MATLNITVTELISTTHVLISSRSGKHFILNITCEGEAMGATLYVINVCVSSWYGANERCRDFLSIEACLKLQKTCGNIHTHKTDKG